MSTASRNPRRGRSLWLRRGRRPGLLLGATVAAIGGLGTALHLTNGDTSRPMPEFDGLPTLGADIVATAAYDETQLVRLRAEYGLDRVIAGATSDTSRALALMDWTHGRWRHDGSTEPSSSDPLVILREASQGRRFRCVEYARVLAAALAAEGMTARVLSLMTADVETRPSGAGHVVVEAFFEDTGQWVMLDPQWNVLPVIDGRPASAVELAQALATSGKPVGVRSPGKVDTEEYARWIAPYLTYFVAPLRYRAGGAAAGFLLLAPRGAAAPRVFQGRDKMRWTVLTRSTVDFYPKPPFDDRDHAR